MAGLDFDEDFFLPDPDFLKALESESDEKEKNSIIVHTIGLIKNCRYSQHLQKCRHNYLNAVKKRKPVVKIEICPYRPALHHMSEFYMKRHLVKCPQREVFVDTLKEFQECTVSNPNIDHLQLNDYNVASIPEDLRVCSLEIPIEPPEVVCETFGLSVENECGDSDCEAGGYDPKIKLAQGFYYSNPQGLTKSEKKLHRERETIRFEEFKGKVGDGNELTESKDSSRS
ncbi:unnamed protein product [Allacma fusca]|uniref:Gametocyte-specific factor 1 n=1 Tax=Allacma fusca TaxID=39272 RepID=A0A8J2KEZ4_9HEXA|nr:unnamed protein product [Allacma fusca]